MMGALRMMRFYREHRWTQRHMSEYLDDELDPRERDRVDRHVGRCPECRRVLATPCVGPTLGAILSAAALTSSVEHAAMLLAFYSAGLAIPLLATALAFNRMTTACAVVERHFPVIIGLGGTILVAMGVLIWTGELFQLNIKAQQLLDSLGLDFFNSV